MTLPMTGHTWRHMRHLFHILRGAALPIYFACVLSGLFAGAATAQDSLFRNGWTLRSDSSTLSFQSVKNETKVETSDFAKFSGSIDETGEAKVVVEVDSVNTKVDLRNVRMRFLFFETYQFPQAVVTLKLDPAQLIDLADVRRKTLTLPFSLTLHGVTNELSAQVAVVLITPDLVRGGRFQSVRWIAEIGGCGEGHSHPVWRGNFRPPLCPEPDRRRRDGCGGAGARSRRQCGAGDQG